TARGFHVELATADAAFETRCTNIFVMCERGAILDRLKTAEKEGSIVVNSSEAIRNTYRHRMIELFAQHHVPAPASQIVASDASTPRPPAGGGIKPSVFLPTKSCVVIYAAWGDGGHEDLDRFAK